MHSVFPTRAVSGSGVLAVQGAPIRQRNIRLCCPQLSLVSDKTWPLSSSFCNAARPTMPDPGSHTNVLPFGRSRSGYAPETSNNTGSAAVSAAPNTIRAAVNRPIRCPPTARRDRVNHTSRISRPGAARPLAIDAR